MHPARRGAAEPTLGDGVPACELVGGASGGGRGVRRRRRPSSCGLQGCPPLPRHPRLRGGNRPDDKSSAQRGRGRDSRGAPRPLPGRARRRVPAVMFRALDRLAARPGARPSIVLLLPARGRKTRHDPPAKSKVGRVKMPPAVDPAEFFVLTERYRQYRQTVSALRCVKGRRASAPSGKSWGGREGGCRLEARPHPGKSSCQRCERRYTRPDPGSWLSAGRRRPPRSTGSSWPGTGRRTGACRS